MPPSQSLKINKNVSIFTLPQNHIFSVCMTNFSNVGSNTNFFWVIFKHCESSIFVKYKFTERPSRFCFLRKASFFFQQYANDQSFFYVKVHRKVIDALWKFEFWWAEKTRLKPKLYEASSTNMEIFHFSKPNCCRLRRALDLMFQTDGCHYLIPLKSLTEFVCVVSLFLITRCAYCTLQGDHHVQKLSEVR